MVKFGVNKKKVCVILTTRGNYAKLITIIEKLNCSKKIDLQIIVGGMANSSRFGLIKPLLEKKNILVNKEISFIVEGKNINNMAKSSGLAIIEFANAFEDLSPDLVVILGDRYETLPVAISATYMNIPIAHLEGGEVSGSIDESIRHAITKLSHLHFPASKEAAKRIEKLGENRDRIFMYGGTSMDKLNLINLSDLKPIRKYQKNNGTGFNLKLVKKEYIIVIQHPVTTEFEENAKNILETLNAIDKLNIETVFILSNVDAGSEYINKPIRVHRELNNPKNIHYFNSLKIEYYGPLLKNASCIVGNSSSGIRESLFLGTPSVNIGTRQNGRFSGKNVIDVNYSSDEIYKAVKKQINIRQYTPKYIYGDGNASSKIVKIIENTNVSNQKLISY